MILIINTFNKITFLGPLVTPVCQSKISHKKDSLEAQQIFSHKKKEIILF